MRNCFPLEIETILEWNNEWKFEWENRIYLNAPKMSIRIQNESQKNKEKKKMVMWFAFLLKESL